MGKQLDLDNATRASVSSQGGREGAGGRNPDAARPGLRNSSGARSPASQLVDIHLKVRILTRAVMALATTLGDEQLVRDLKDVLNGKA